jgi:hypothetical protein
MSKCFFKFIATLVALAVATCAGFWFVDAPEHWLTRVDFGTVTVDDRPLQADVYLGHPTENEADVIAFEHVPRVGDYFLDFEGEGYREASNHEYIRFKRGVWTFRRMNKGPFGALLPFRKVNEFRLPPSNGHTVVAQF